MQFEPDTLYSEHSVTVRRIGLFYFLYAIELGILEQVTNGKMFANGRDLKAPYYTQAQK